MSVTKASSPRYLRKLGVNRMWPTSPINALHLAAATPQGQMTDVAKDTSHHHASTKLNDRREQFLATGPKFQLVITPTP